MKLELPPTIHTVLVVEDQLSMIKAYKKFLTAEPLNLVYVRTGTDALEYLKQQTPSIILLDLKLPDIDGKEVLKYVTQQQLDCPVIVITWQDSVDSVVEIMRMGVFDYLEKPVAVERLTVTLRNAIRQYELQHYIDFNLITSCRDNYYGMIGSSKPMQILYQTINNVAKSPVDILIMGESGTGKELCTKALHQASNRASQPFVTVNCAAIPENLMESQLFGHVKGAFTGAIEHREGAASQADGGTLFLDEIGELDLSLQKVLLRFVQTKTFQRIGGNAQEQVDIRIICATNQDLFSEVQAGRFRKDLYYRLNAVTIKMPSLRDRGEDILLLAKVFLRQYSEQEQKYFQEITPAAEQLLLQYHWPGNIRQLQNVIHNVVIFNQGTQLTAEMLKPQLTEAASSNEMPVSPTKSASITITATTTAFSPTVPILSNQGLRTLDAIEKDVILAAIEYYRGDVVQAARALDIGVTTIYRKLREWNITLKRGFFR